MREIKFRGKDKNGNWVYGDRVHMAKFIAIKDQSKYGTYYKVDPKTIGEFIGFKDVNDVDIYEGDILQDTKYKIYLGFVTIFRGGWQLKLPDRSNYKPHYENMVGTDNVIYPYKILGNIYDDEKFFEVWKV